MRDRIQEVNDATYEAVRARCRRRRCGLRAGCCRRPLAGDGYTQRAAFLGVEPSGRSFDVEGASFSWLGEDGLVTKHIHHWDAPSLLTQLGVLAAE